jgi:hypothetical protein
VILSLQSHKEPKLLVGAGAEPHGVSAPAAGSVSRSGTGISYLNFFYHHKSSTYIKYASCPKKEISKNVFKFPTVKIT